MSVDANATGESFGSTCPGRGALGCNDGAWTSQVVRLDSGDVRTVCLDPHSAEDQQLQADVSRAFAIVSTCAFVFNVALGMCYLTHVKRDFDRVERVRAGRGEEPARSPLWPSPSRGSEAHLTS